MSATKQFELGDVLSVTTKLLLSKDGIDGIGRVLDFMEGSRLTTFEFPAAANRCRPVLLKLYPQISADNLQKEIADLEFRLDNSGHKQECVNEWVEELTIKFGKSLAVPKMSSLNEINSKSSDLAFQAVKDEIENIRQKGIKARDEIDNICQKLHKV